MNDRGYIPRREDESEATDQADADSHLVFCLQLTINISGWILTKHFFKFFFRSELDHRMEDVEGPNQKFDVRQGGVRYLAKLSLGVQTKQ